jgi:hypothetical protein
VFNDTARSSFGFVWFLLLVLFEPAIKKHENSDEKASRTASFEAKENKG